MEEEEFSPHELNDAQRTHLLRKPSICARRCRYDLASPRLTVSRNTGMPVVVQLLASILRYLDSTYTEAQSTRPRSLDQSAERYAGWTNAST